LSLTKEIGKNSPRDNSRPWENRENHHTRCVAHIKNADASTYMSGCDCEALSLDVVPAYEIKIQINVKLYGCMRPHIYKIKNNIILMP
jgi:hypothetical protein